MPPSEPILEQVPAAVKARLATLTAGATYWHTPAEVTRDLKNFDESRAAAGQPGYHVIEGKITREKLTSQDDHIAQEIVIAGWIKDEDGDGRRQGLTRAIGDVVKMIYTDETWGLTGLSTIWTDVVSIDVDEAVLSSRPYAYFELAMRVEYDLARTAV